MASVESLERSSARLLRALPARYHTDPLVFAEEKDLVREALGHPDDRNRWP